MSNSEPEAICWEAGPTEYPIQLASRNRENYAAYHFDDVIFLVEGQLFKVPRHYFQNDSEVFNGMFSLPSNGAVDGSSDQQPLRLDGILKIDFLRLLEVLYPMHFRKIELDSVEEWTSVLKLSTMWNFADVRELAVKEMSALRMDPLDKIILAQKYDIPDWLVPAISEVAQRREPISLREANDLGMECVLKIAQVRENWAECCVNCMRYNRLGQQLVPTSAERGEKCNTNFAHTIRTVFHL